MNIKLKYIITINNRDYGTEVLIPINGWENTQSLNKIILEDCMPTISHQIADQVCYVLTGSTKVAMLEVESKNRFKAFGMLYTGKKPKERKKRQKRTSFLATDTIKADDLRKAVKILKKNSTSH